jgi:SanA protein
VLLLPAETRGRQRTLAELPADGVAALVLAGDLDRRGEPSRTLTTRLQTALDLYRSGKTRWLLVSGNEREPPAMRRWLEQRGVPPEAIVADYGARRTYDSLQRAAGIFGLRHVLVVTSDFHLPRALWLAQQLHLEAEGVAASSATLSGLLRRHNDVREYGARNRALVDLAFPPPMRSGPHDVVPDGFR